MYRRTPASSQQSDPCTSRSTTIRTGDCGAAGPGHEDQQRIPAVAERQREADEEGGVEDVTWSRRPCGIRLGCLRYSRARATP